MRIKSIKNFFKDDNAIGTVCCGIGGALLCAPSYLANICCFTGPCCCIPNILSTLLTLINGGIGAVSGCITDTMATVCAVLASATGGMTTGAGTATIKAIRI